MGSHKILAVLDKLDTHNIIPSLISGGCTSLIQSLKVAINKLFKEILYDFTNTAIFESESTEEFYR
ncbi:hypothetical protein L873DRAFT_1931058 [Choiromyces venosus 120613-1]|uniref:DDE-1 domain-containing protein n=1 Tax=Choiromyces venosus 120613-1 TaxID=1336337 RepID=A0A3N4JBG2_9PEZI|nr:hypothetical protein L873DRAFT_1931058 [Choiromyces venosus 120613-1]